MERNASSIEHKEKSCISRIHELTDMFFGNHEKMVLGGRVMIPKCDEVIVLRKECSI